MKTKMVVSCLAAVLLLLAAVTAAAAPNLVMTRYVIAGGGGRIGGATLVLTNTIGEPVAGPLVVAGNYGAAAGFWPGTSAGDQLFLPLIARPE